MTTTDRALMIMLREAPNQGAIAASLLGAILWGKDRKGRVIAQHGGGDYAAQMLLGRMKKSGLVRIKPGPGASRWELTADGVRRAIRAGQDALFERAQTERASGKKQRATRAQVEGVSRAAKAITRAATTVYFTDSSWHSRSKGSHTGRRYHLPSGADAALAFCSSQIVLNDDVAITIAELVRQGQQILLCRRCVPQLPAIPTDSGGPK